MNTPILIVDRCPGRSVKYGSGPIGQDGRKSPASSSQTVPTRVQSMKIRESLIFPLLPLAATLWAGLGATASMANPPDDHTLSQYGATELVVVDGTDPRLLELSRSARFDVVRIDAGVNPIAAISKALDEREAIGLETETLHVLAHGTPGSVSLGGVGINA